MKVSALVVVASLSAACASNHQRAAVTAEVVLAAARARTSTECARYALGCDAEASLVGGEWFVTVSPLLGIEDGEHVHGIHLGWNLLYTVDGRYLRDLGWQCAQAPTPQAGMSFDRCRLDLYSREHGVPNYHLIANDGRRGA